ncbi:hypothetical protein KKG46_02245 [Patescibacteria group bacterium]|nr:hypothetical protein [Patescibacteria group bacterium]
MNDVKQLDGSVELLDERHKELKGPNGKNLVGWIPTSEGVGGIHNPYGWASLRVVLNKITDGKIVPLYDQSMLVENAGAIVIAHLDHERIALINCMRMTGPRLMPDAGSAYVKRLNDEKRWSELMGTLGQWKWEAPRGLIQDPKTTDLEEFILKAARLEALEEAGLKLASAKIAGQVNPNSTFFPHAQWVVEARIESMDQANPEVLEIIGATKLFTIDELRKLNHEGLFDDSLTLAGMALCGFSL